MANFMQCLFILLAISASVATSAAAATSSSPLEGEKLLLRPGFLDPAGSITKCWSSILGIEGCAKDVLASFLTLQVQLSSECCSAIEGVGESCLLNIFGNPPFNPFFPPLLKTFCKASPAPSAK